MHFYHRLSCLFFAKVDKNHLVLVTDRIPRRPDPRGYRRFPWLVDWCASGPIVCDGGRGFGRWRLLYDTQLPRTPWFYFLFAKVHENYSAFVVPIVSALVVPNKASMVCQLSWIQLLLISLYGSVVGNMICRAAFVTSALCYILNFFYISSRS